MNDKLKETASALVAHCRNHTEAEGLITLYAKDAVSVEAALMPGSESRENVGVDSIKGKHDWWNSAYEQLAGTVSDPMFHGDDRFSVIFEMTARNRQSGETSEMKEVGIYTINESGKIVREEFFYSF